MTYRIRGLTLKIQQWNGLIASIPKTAVRDICFLAYQQFCMQRNNRQLQITG